MKIILSGFLAVTLLMSASSAAFGSTKKSGGTATHRRTNSGKHRSGVNHRGGKFKSNVPTNRN